MKALSISGATIQSVGAAVAVKTATLAFLVIRGSDYALHQYVAGAAFAPRLDGLPDAMLMMVCLLPQLAAVFALCDYVPMCLSCQATSVMPRLAGRRLWAARMASDLMALTLAYVLLGNLLGLAVLVLPGDLPLEEALPVIASALLLELLSSALLVLLTNVTALWLEPIIAVALVPGVHGGVLLTQACLPLSWATAAAPWLPSARSVLAWHDVPGVASGAPGLTLGGSCALLAALALLAAFVLVRIVSCSDIV